MANSGTSRWRLVRDPDKSNLWLWEWCVDGEDDIDALFERVRNGAGTDDDHELFDACILDRFVTNVYQGESVAPWIMEALASAFTNVLAGSEWCDEIRLPGRPTTPTRPWRDQRDLEIFCAVSNAVSAGEPVGAAISAAADSMAVSVETARAAYYAWKKSVSKKRVEI